MRKIFRSTLVPTLTTATYFDIAKYLKTLACSSTNKSQPLICSFHDLDRAPVICSLDSDRSSIVDLPARLVKYFSSHIIKPTSSLIVDSRFKSLPLIITRSVGCDYCRDLTHPSFNFGEESRAKILRDTRQLVYGSIFFLHFLLLVSIRFLCSWCSLIFTLDPYYWSDYAWSLHLSCPLIFTLAKSSGLARLLILSQMWGFTNRP